MLLLKYFIITQYAFNEYNNTKEHNMYENNILSDNTEILNTIPDLQAIASLGTEDFSGTVKSISTYFIKKLNTMSSVLTNNVDRLSNVPFKLYNSNSTELAKNNKLIIDIKSNVKFRNISSIEVPVTLGMKIDMYQAVNNLYAVKDILEFKIYDIVDKADTVSSKMLSSSDFRTSGRKHKEDESIDKDIISLMDVLENVIDVHGVNDRMSIGKLLPNMNSLDELNKKLTELNEIVNPKKFKNLVKLISNINDNVTILHEEYLKDQDEVKKDRLVELGYYLNSVAKVVTVSISVVHLISQLTDTYTHLLERLEKSI